MSITLAPITLTFPHVPGEPFSAWNAAVRWLDNHDCSHGELQRDSPVAVMRGPSWKIAKWRDLSPTERAAAHAVLTFGPGGCRDGDVTLTWRDGP